MVRRYDDVIEVRSRERSGEQEGPAPAITARPGEPEVFLWRGRVYRVRDVLGHWHERRSWWTEQAARAVHGDAGAPTAGASTADASVPGADREVWRVEASAGLGAAPGIYDLCRGDGTGAAWRLLRVAD